MKTTNSPPYQRLLELLIDARKEVGMTQQDLSKRLQRPQSYVSKYERGERRLDVIEYLQIIQCVGADPFGLLREVQPLLGQPAKDEKPGID